MCYNINKKNKNNNNTNNNSDPQYLIFKFFGFL